MIVPDRELGKCRNGCFQFPVVVPVGRADDLRYMVECPVCQRGTRLLPKEEAKKEWRENHARA